VKASCLLHGSNGLTFNGSVAYCEHVRDTDRYMWSVSEGDITFARAGDRGERATALIAAVAVRIQQTGRSNPHCVRYLQQRRDRGDGVNRSIVLEVVVEVLACA
jgi:hypothetical protein